MIKCQECRHYLGKNDQVVLDIFNGLTHKDCFKGDKSMIRDIGSYRVIINTYKIFRDAKSPSR